jgi:hypothetical protein
VVAWLKEVRRKFDPDTVFVHHVLDTHRDHQAVHDAAIRVFVPGVSILKYEIPKLAAQRYAINPQWWVDTTQHMQAKLKMTDCHGSQTSKSIYLSHEMLTCRAKVAYIKWTGQEDGFAEEFEIHTLYTMPRVQKRSTRGAVRKTGGGVLRLITGEQIRRIIFRLREEEAKGMLPATVKSLGNRGIFEGASLDKLATTRDVVAWAVRNGAQAFLALTHEVSGRSKRTGSG